MVRFRITPETLEIKRMEMLFIPDDTSEYYFKQTYIEAKQSLVNHIENSIAKLQISLNTVNLSEYPS